MGKSSGWSGLLVTISAACLAALALARGAAAAPGPARGAPTTDLAWHPRSGTGDALMLGFGVSGFTDASMRFATTTGVAWTARFVTGTRLPLGLELAYVGGAVETTGWSGDRRTQLLHNGLEALLRFNVDLLSRPGLIQAFAAAGLGALRYANLDDGPTPTASRDRDNVLVAPVGLGVAAAHRGLVIEARFGYRRALADQMFAPRDLSTWTATFGVGAEF